MASYGGVLTPSLTRGYIEASAVPFADIRGRTFNVECIMLNLARPKPDGRVQPGRDAFSLIELLVVIAIIGLLLSLLLPAVQAARESSRIAHCSNNLRQVAVAVLLHESQKGFFPHGGWGYEWVGIPGRGSSEKQPGSWIYSTLPYLGLQTLHDLGLEGDAKSFSQRLVTPISLFTCPSRRACSSWLVQPQFDYMRHPRPMGAVDSVSRSDYAINSGATGVTTFYGPKTVAEGDSPKFKWPRVEWAAADPQFDFTGISHLRLGARPAQLEDGLSGTYLAGEKFLEPSNYEDGESPGDNDSLNTGYCSDNHRFTRTDFPPRRDDDSVFNGQYRFGGPHAEGWMAAFCDGSVHFVAFTIDPEVHYRSGHVADGGGPIPAL